MDLPNRSDLFRVFRDEVLAKNGRLSPEMVEREGTDANILAAATSAVGDEVVSQLALAAAGLYLDSSHGLLLERLIFDRYGLKKKSAAPALGSANFSTTVANPAAFTIPKGTILSSAEGKSYETVVDAVFPLGAVSIPPVQIRSIIAGLDQTAKPATIVNIVDRITGAASDLAVTNALATSGAADEEKEDDFRERGRAFFSTARKGTLRAIEQGALAVPGVKSAAAFEVLSATGHPERIVLLVVTDEYTDTLASFSAIPASYAAQSQALAAAVFNSLDDVRAGGIYVHVQVAQVVMTSVQLRLSFTAGVNYDQVAYNARVAAVNYINGLKPGAVLSVVELMRQVQMTPGLLRTGSEIYSPVGDVIVKPLQVLRASLATVTAVAIGTGSLLQATTNPDAFVV